MIFKLTKKLIVLVALLTVTATPAFAQQFLIISDKNHSFHQRLADLLTKKLENDNHQTENIHIDQIASTSYKKYTALVTIGYTAASSIFEKNLNKPVLSLLIPRQAFNQLLAVTDSTKRYLYSGIYIDQPISRQIQLINQLSPAFNRIGVLYGKHSYSRRHAISTQLRTAGFDVKSITVLDRTELITETRHLSETTDLLLAIPDNTIFNRRSIKGILLTTYRNRIPVIGFSKAYVNAGALAAIYSSEENISRHAAELLEKNLKHSFISASREYPRYYELEINKKVARSLNLNLRNPDSLLEKIKQAEAINPPSSDKTERLPHRG